MLQPRIVGIAGAIHVAPCGGTHVAALAGEPRPAALGRRHHAVIHAERIEHAVVAVQQAHCAALDGIERDRAEVTCTVEHGDRNRLSVIGKGRGREREPGVVAVVGHADQRHASGKPELARQNFRRARHLIEAAAIERRCIGDARQHKALRRLLDHAARQHAGQRKIVPAGQPRVDIGDVASHAAQCRDHRVDRFRRILRGVLVAGEAFFLVIEDQPRSVRLRHLHQGDAGIVRAGKPESCKIHRFAARKLVADLRNARVGEAGAELVEADPAHRLARQPAREARACCAQPGMTRSDT